MNEEHFNLQLRKFLKKVGVTSQREIERAVRDALSNGKLSGSERLEAVVTLRVAGADLEVEIGDTIALSE